MPSQLPHLRITAQSQSTLSGTPLVSCSVPQVNPYEPYIDDCATKTLPLSYIRKKVFKNQKVLGLEPISTVFNTFELCTRLFCKQKFSLNFSKTSTYTRVPQVNPYEPHMLSVLTVSFVT
jgi:hypothetical protein